MWQAIRGSSAPDAVINPSARRTENNSQGGRSHGKLLTVTAVRPPARFGHMRLDGDRHPVPRSHLEVWRVSVFPAFPLGVLVRWDIMHTFGARHGEGRGLGSRCAGPPAWRQGEPGAEP